MERSWSFISNVQRCWSVPTVLSLLSSLSFDANDDGDDDEVDVKEQDT